MSFTKRLCEGYKKLKTSVKRDNYPNNEIKSSSSIYNVSMVWRSLHHKEILLSARNTNVGENVFNDLFPNCPFDFVLGRYYFQAGDADSSRAPGLTSGLQGSVNDHRGALLLVPQWQCISSFVFYFFKLDFIVDFDLMRKRKRSRSVLWQKPHQQNVKRAK